MANQASAPRFDTSSWLSELDRATRDREEEPAPELSGQGLVISAGGGALRAGQVVAVSAIEGQNSRLDLEGKEGARYYALGLEAALTAPAGSAATVSKAASEMVERLESQLGAALPPGMSLGQIAELEQGLKKIQQGRLDELEGTELTSIAQAPAARALARSAGVPEDRLKKADKERRAAMMAIAASAKEVKAERERQESGGQEPEASEMLKRAREALPGWREIKEESVAGEELEPLISPEGPDALGDRLDAQRRPSAPAPLADEPGFGM